MIFIFDFRVFCFDELFIELFSFSNSIMNIVRNPWFGCLISFFVIFLRDIYFSIILVTIFSNALKDKFGSFFCSSKTECQSISRRSSMKFILSKFIVSCLKRFCFLGILVFFEGIIKN